MDPMNPYIIKFDFTVTDAVGFLNSELSEEELLKRLEETFTLQYGSGNYVIKEFREATEEELKEYNEEAPNKQEIN